MPPPAPERIELPNNPFGPYAYVRGFGGFVWKIGWVVNRDDPYAGILAVVGFPKEDERQTEFGAAQRCEKATLTWLRDHRPPWDIQLEQVKESGPGDGIDPATVAARMAEIIELASRPLVAAGDD